MRLVERQEYEGGTRTPFITCWPGRITPGESDEIVCTIDLPASLAGLVGQPLPDSACLDSIDLHPLLLGESGANGRDHLIQQDNGANGTYGLRVGHWKLLRHDKGFARNVVVEKALATTKVPRYQLFNLAVDPGEQHDVATTHADETAAMIKRLDEAIAAGRTRR